MVCPPFFEMVPMAGVDIIRYLIVFTVLFLYHPRLPHDLSNVIFRGMRVIKPPQHHVIMLMWCSPLKLVQFFVARSSKNSNSLLSLIWGSLRNMRRWNGWTGSIIAVCWRPLAMYRRLNMKECIMMGLTGHAKRHDSMYGLLLFLNSS